MPESTIPDFDPTEIIGFFAAALGITTYAQASDAERERLLKASNAIVGAISTLVSPLAAEASE